MSNFNVGEILRALEDPNPRESFMAKLAARETEKTAVTDQVVDTPEDLTVDNPAVQMPRTPVGSDSQGKVSAIIAKLSGPTKAQMPSVTVTGTTMPTAPAPVDSAPAIAADVDKTAADYIIETLYNIHFPEEN